MNNLSVGIVEKHYIYDTFNPAVNMDSTAEREPEAPNQCSFNRPGPGRSYPMSEQTHEITHNMNGHSHPPVAVGELEREKPRRILIVEDNEANTFFLMKTLEKRGHEVLCAADGEAALELWRSRPFDCILMDIQMPLLGGDEAVRVIRKEESAATVHVPIIALTACSLEGDREHFLAIGFDGYLSKPFRIEELIEQLMRF